MAAGLGFKTFTTGEVLTAADVNGYLMQGILVFASEAARDAAITSPQEGQFAFTKDNNSLWYYTGSAWAASGATGDIEGVTAGIGISGGGTSGTVTITNSMATAIDAKGDLVAGTGADTFARLAVGANDTVLTADSSTSTGLKWATPSSAATLSEITSGTFSGSSLTFSSLTLDTYIFMSRSNTFDLSAAASMRMKINSIATGYRYVQFYTDGTSAEPSNNYTAAGTIWQTVLGMNNAAGVGQFYFLIENCKATGYTRYSWDISYRRSGNSTRVHDWGWGVVETNAQATSLTFDINAGTWSNGSYSLYGA